MIRTKSGGYEVVVDGANKKKKYVGFYQSKREAKDAESDAKHHERQIRQGKLPAEHDTKRLLGDSLDNWLDAIKASRSLETFGDYVKYQIKPALASAVLANLTAKHIKAWHTDLVKQYAVGSVNSALGVLSIACSWFVEQGWLVVNPCYGVERHEEPERPYNWIKTRGELEKLLLACHDELRDIVALAVGTGMRIDELLHLQWTDVNLETRLITVQRGRQGTTKSGKMRHVPILDSVLSVFKERALRRCGGDLVFPGNPRARGKLNGSSVRGKSGVQQGFKRALKKAGLDTKLRFHDLRHTAASWWVLSGGDIFRLSKMLGHSSVAITQAVYAHLCPTAWTQDYARISFHVPGEPAKVLSFATVEPRWNRDAGIDKPHAIAQ